MPAHLWPLLGAITLDILVSIAVTACPIVGTLLGLQLTQALCDFRHSCSLLLKVLSERTVVRFESFLLRCKVCQGFAGLVWGAQVKV